MPSTYTRNSGIEKIGAGEQSGSWGDTTNDNFDIIDRSINGVVTLSLSGTSSTLTTSDGILSDGQYRTLLLGGAPSGTHTITISPNDAQKMYLVKNNTAQSVVFTQGSGGNVTIAAGDSAIIYSNGGGSVAAVGNLADDLAMSSAKITGGSITGITDLAIADGGTGASTAADARTNLGLGTAATLNVGTSANNVVQLDGSARLPAVDGSQLTGLVSFPAGGIILWSGSVASIPAGWALCNGLNGTPNLTDRFVVGAGSTYAVGATGGQNSITSVPAHTHAAGTLVADSSGSHSHSISDPGHNHTLQGLMNTAGSGNPGDGSNAARGYFTGSSGNTPTWLTFTQSLLGGMRNLASTTGISVVSGGAHTHTVSGSTSSTGSASVDIRPLYYALAYIMKL